MFRFLVINLHLKLCDVLFTRGILLAGGDELNPIVSASIVALGLNYALSLNFLICAIFFSVVAYFGQKWQLISLALIQFIVVIYQLGIMRGPLYL